MRTKTMPLDFAKLHAKGKEAATVIRLAMAANDIHAAAQTLRMCRSEDSPFPEESKRGVGMYFVRLQCGHLVEAVKITSDIESRPALMKRIERLPEDRRQAFSRLCECQEKRPRRKEFERFVVRMRNNLSFHYDENEKVVMKALKSRAERPGSRKTKATIGDEIGSMRFHFADDLVDTAVCRDILGIPMEIEGEELKTEGDKQLQFGSDLSRDLLFFAWSFVWDYMRECSA